MSTDTLSQLRAGQLAGIKRLDLSCGLTVFPPEIYDLADSLEILNLTGNRLSDLPDDFARLNRLKVVFLSQKDFRHVPPVLGGCPNLSMIGFKSNRIEEVDGRAFNPALRWLILTDNRIQRLPLELGQCLKMQKLMLAGNRLSDLPEEMAACVNLELLRLSANDFKRLPDWLGALPKLAWLAIGGNPCTPLPAVSLESQAIPEADWQDLTLEEKLGEGASGVIYKAAWSGKSGGQARPVAVKIFKGAMTSDGLPDCEMAACMAAGTHPNLIGAEARVVDHSDGSHGLVMPLIDPDFKNLAGPPSLESCTRDIYPDDVEFSLPVLLRMLSGLAAAARHLHTQGILHGDFYAHNVLWNAAGDCLLGDFGAACNYKLDGGLPAEALERLEVRAFGCLMEELLDRTVLNKEGLDGGSTEVVENLQKLQADCLIVEVTARPSFSEIVERLKRISVESGLPGFLV